MIENLVSVVMITYNHEKYLAEAIKGVLLQKTNFNIELIIANDCSPDKSDEVINHILKDNLKNISIKYIRHEQNIGMMSNFIFALEQAKGEYVALCEGDDYWTDSLKLQKQVDFLRKNSDFSMCFHNAMLHFEESPELNRPFRNIEDREYSGVEILKEWTIPTASVVFKNEQLNYLCHPDFIYGDIILFLSLAESGKIYGMKEIMSIYRKHEGGVTAPEIFSDDMLKKYIKHHLAIKKNFGGKYKNIESESLSRSYSSLSFRYLKINIRQSIFYLFKSFMENPLVFISDIKNNLEKSKSKF